MLELPLGQQPYHRILDAKTAIARKHVCRTFSSVHLTSNCSIGLDNPHLSVPLPPNSGCYEAPKGPMLAEHRHSCPASVLAEMAFVVLALR